MQRIAFSLNEPFREINSDDVNKEFFNEKLESLKIDLSTFYKENQGDKHVWVYEIDNKILAVMSFLQTEHYFQMDIIAKNQLEDELCREVKPTFSLYKVLENESVKLGFQKIRLDSISERIEYWERIGYKMIGMPQHCEGWGDVFPMEKNL